jgi:hypothetical protein
MSFKQIQKRTFRLNKQLLFGDTITSEGEEHLLLYNLIFLDDIKKVK